MNSKYDDLIDEILTQPGSLEPIPTPKKSKIWFVVASVVVLGIIILCFV